MREIFSFIFGLITDPLSLPIDTWKEWLILGVIGTVAYIIAYRYVGTLYRSGDINGSTVGSIIHWVIRLLVFVLIWAINYSIIWIIKFIASHWIIVFSILGSIIMIIAISCAIIWVCRKYGRQSLSK